MCQQLKIMVLILFFLLSLQTSCLDGATFISDKMFYAAIKYEQGPGVKFFAVNEPTTVTEPKPTKEDFSDSECGSIVDTDTDENRIPKTIYNGQCSDTDDQTCRQGTKVIHTLKRVRCKDKSTCEYHSAVMNVQTVCVKVLTENHKTFSPELEALINRDSTADIDMEPIQTSEVNWNSKCPWDWVAHLDENRFPRVFQRAVCRSNTKNECKTIYKDIVMFRKVSHQCIGPFCGYERYVSREPVACVSTNNK